MDESEVRRIVEANIEPLMEAFGIPHWRIGVEYGAIDQSDIGHNQHFRCPGQCFLKPNYNNARILLDPANLEDEEHVVKVLLHELAHVVVSPFRVYRNFATSMIKRNSSQDSQEDELWPYCDEQAVINIERLWRGSREYWRKGWVAAPSPQPVPLADDAPAAIC